MLATLMILYHLLPYSVSMQLMGGAQGHACMTCAALWWEGDFLNTEIHSYCSTCRFVGFTVSLARLLKFNYQQCSSDVGLHLLIWATSCLATKLSISSSLYVKLCKCIESV